MTIGQGKYDDLCSHAREQAEAAGAILIIVGGNKGGGFSVQASHLVILALPEVLEDLARQLRADLERGQL